VPYDELYIPTRIGDTHVIASGSKDDPPLVLLHPTGGGAVIWIRNIKSLSQHYRTYAIDTVSETNKSILTQPISIRRQRQQFADWATDLFNGLDIESACVAGNSFGGFLALNTAFYLPERIKKLVLISPAATFTAMWAWYAHFPIANMFGTKRWLLWALDWIWQDFPIDDCIAQLRATTALTGRPRHWFPSVFSDKELRAIQTPILLLIGDHEVIYRPENAIRRATRLVPNLKAEIIPNANHIAEYTNAEAVNAKTMNFFANSNIARAMEFETNQEAI
jgi:pimeloyl-ACP methyl ester carboxylesterase